MEKVLCSMAEQSSRKDAVQYCRCIPSRKGVLKFRMAEQRPEQRVILIATYPGAGSDQAKINIKFSRFGDGAEQRRTDSQAV